MVQWEMMPPVECGCSRASQEQVGRKWYRGSSYSTESENPRVAKTATTASRRDDEQVWSASSLVAMEHENVEGSTWHQSGLLGKEAASSS